MKEEHIALAKALMKEIMLDNGSVDRNNPEEYPDEWVNRIAPIAGKFFDNNPEYNTEKHIKDIAITDPEKLYDIEGYEELSNVLNDYFDHV